MNHSPNSRAAWWQAWVQGPRGVLLLELCSIFYIFFPLCLFLLGWIKIWIALPLVVLTLFTALRGAREAVHSLHPGPPDAQAPSEDRQILRRGLLIFALTAAVVACTGIGGYTYQFFDYAFYDGFTRSLIESTWPLAFQEAGGIDEPMIGIYHFAYYLPSALLGKLLGWTIAYHFYFVWATVGVFLVLVWFFRIVGKTSLWLAALFLFFGGIDILGHLFTAPFPSADPGSWYDYFTGTYWWSTGRGWLDHWIANYALSDGRDIMNGVFYKFYGPMSFLVDGPYHFLPGTVALMMMFHDILRRKTTVRLGFLWASLPIASVLVAIGAAPFVVVAVLRNRFQHAFSFDNLVAGIPLLLLFLLYYGSINVEAAAGPLWNYQRISEVYPLLFLFYLAEFGIYAALYFLIRRDSNTVPPVWVWTALALFLIAPWYRLGIYNDFTVKVVIPAQILFILALATALLSQAESRRPLKRILIALLCVGTLASLGNIIRAVEFGFHPAAPPMESVRRVNEVLPLNLALQGRANPDAPFWRWLAREPVYTPPLEIPVAREWNFMNDPEAIEGWDLYGREHKVGREGLMIYTDGKNALMRLRDVQLDADRIGTCLVDIRVEDYYRTALAHQIILVWANPASQTEDADWPYPRFQASIVQPLERSLSTNPYWRGDVSDLALYLDMPEARACRVYVERLRFFRR